MLGVSVVGVQTISKDGGRMKNRPRKPKGVSMSTVREIDRIVRAGLHQSKRALSSRHRREFSERLDYGR
jgi:hypothetical protein